MTKGEIKRLFSRKNWGGRDINHLTLQAVEGTATRAVYEGYRQIPSIEAAFRVPYSSDPKSGEKFDAIILEMDIYTASEFCQQLLNAIDAASPKHPRSARHTAYGEGGNV